MDRSVDGYFSIGGRRGNCNWHGKVAALTRTTLNNATMPDETDSDDDYRPADVEEHVQAGS